MNRLCCLIIMLLACRICEGQNLVPNPSFEDSLACPTFVNDITSAVGWFSSRGSPDYFNPCANISEPRLGVPVNLTGHQNAFDGNCYAGLLGYGFYSSGFPATVREFIGAELSDTLIPGTKYFVSCYVSRADTFTHDCACNHLGFKFSTYYFSTSSVTSTVFLDNTSHVDTNAIIYDKINWNRIGGSFIADSSYRYLIIGNFYDNANTDTADCDTLAAGYHFAYYYIDLVCVSSDSLACNGTLGVNELNNEVEIVLFPNPFNDKLNITGRKNELSEIILYDIVSRKLLQQKFINTISLSTEQLAKGVYLYEVRNKSRVIKKGKVVKE